MKNKKCRTQKGHIFIKANVSSIYKSDINNQKTLS